MGSQVVAPGAVPPRVRAGGLIGGVLIGTLGVYEHLETSKQLVKVLGIAVPDYVWMILGVLLILWYLLSPEKHASEAPAPVASASDHSAAITGDNNTVQQTHTENHHHYTSAEPETRVGVFARLQRQFPDRVILSSTPQDVMRAYEGTTTLRGDAVFAQAYRDKWIFTTATVVNVAADKSPRFDGQNVRLVDVVVVFAEPIPAPSIVKPVLLSFYFAEGSADRVRHFTKGDEISVLGKVVRASHHDIRLDECELLT